MKVLLATDGSAGAEVAHGLVRSLDWPPASTVRVATVFEPPDVLLGSPWPTSLGTLDELEAEAQSRARAVVDGAAKGLAGRGWSVEQAVLRGRAASCIVDEASRFAADLVVVGSRGHGPILSMLLGSVAAEVTAHAPCPVLVARRPLLTRAVLGDDGSDCARVAEEVLSRWPIFAEVAFEVVSVGAHAGPWLLPESVTQYPPGTPDYFTSMREVLGRHREIAASAARRLVRAGLRAEPLAELGDPAATILRVADERQADLVVVGTHGRTGLDRLLLGSVARNLLHHAKISVLIVRRTAPPR